MFSREGRVRLFLGFLVLVLVLVNSQSLQLSSETRTLLSESFNQGFETKARLVAEALSSLETLELPDRNRRLEEQARIHGLRSACLLDWNARLLTGGGCAPPLGGAFDRLDRDGRRLLVENGWVTASLASPYDVDGAEATGYLVLGGSEGEPSLGVLRVSMAAPSLAAANRRFRTTLVYQISAISLVLLSVVLFFRSLLGEHQKLVAEAKTVATELARDVPEARDEGQFLLDTFQQVVARLKEKEEELRALHLLEKTRADETEALASDIIRSMTTGLVSLDPSGAVALVNPAAEKIFAIQQAQARGRPVAEMFAGSPELAGMVEDALGSGAYHLRGQARFRTAGGNTLHLGVSVIPLLSARGGPRGALCLLADLTEVVELRERLFLRENLARLGEMTAGIAHEFRNGLATIMGNAKLLKSASAKDAEEIGEAVLGESQALARVVTEFLQFAKPEPLQPESVDLGVLAGAVVEEVRPRAAESGIELRCEGRGAVLEGDEALLRKALSNLVSNALESLVAAGTKHGSVVVELSSDAATAVVRVRDNGPGVEPAHRERIFTPFFTLKENGTGLGLSVVQKIIVSHNGTVELEPTASGASFVIRIPLDSTPAPASSEWV